MSRRADADRSRFRPARGIAYPVGVWQLCVQHPWASGAVLTLVLGLLSLWVMAALVVRVPADYFLRPPDALRWQGWRHAALTIVRNTLGGVLIVVGVLLALPGVPGQGLLTLLTGLLLTDLPGKRRLELRLLRLPRLKAGLDHLRARHGKSPLLLPAEVPVEPDRPPPLV